MELLKNKWFKVAVSLIGIVFTTALLYFDYIVFFYDIEYTDKTKFAIFTPIICLLISLLNIYTRRSPITAVLAMINCVLLLPLAILAWGNWPILIPAAAVTVFGFFCCHMNDTGKVILGTIFLLMYIVAGVLFYMYLDVFSVSTEDTLLSQGVSPSGAFRYYVVDVKNKTQGKKVVYVQPNSLDIDKGFMTLHTTIRRMVRQQPNPVEFECEWNGPYMYINGEEFFDESKYIDVSGSGATYNIADNGWEYTYFSLNYPVGTTIDNIKKKLDTLVTKWKQRS
ncbi:MAG: hypothetical protein K6G68_05245 [Oscillospiraceae bacterium]|nr:hypothetical protein [Oscillospiraceae bacterium]